MHPYESEAAAARDIARAAGDIIRRYFRTENGLTHKDDGSPVTQADIEVNRLVIAEIQARFGDVVIGEEESTGEYGAGRRWFCDPIDGTKGYVWGTPTAMFSLALVVDGVSQIGVAYDPFLNHLFEGVRGHNSTCDGAPIHVSSGDMHSGHIALASDPMRVVDDAPVLARLAAQGARFGTFSGAVYKMTLIARGSLIGYFEKGLDAHDVAAAQVIIEGAGGKVTAYDGSPLDYRHPFRGAVASNGVIHSGLIAALQA